MKINVSHFVLTGVLAVAVFASSIFLILPSSMPNQSAFATFPGENGKIAFISTRDGNYEIYVMNPDGSEQTRLTNNPTVDQEPDWSPDGTKIVFVREGSGGGTNEIYVMNADGSEQTNISNNPAHEHFPSWSPDGEKIVFNSDGNGNLAIYVMNADGSEQTNISNNPAAADAVPSWSPDGTKIAFASFRDGNSEIYVMNADGSEQTRLTNNPAIDTTPDWSPDGEKIVFRRGIETQNPEIYVMNPDGSEQTNISNNPAIDFDPSWSPDGTKIAFTSYREGGGEVFIMNPDGSEQTNISKYPGRPDAHPDWGTATAIEDITPPVITVPQDITEEATGPNGAEVSFEVSAEDDVDGNVTLEEDGTTITQDDVGGDITISCEPPSGSEFPVGDTTVECSARDATGNSAEETFTVTVQDTTDPDVEITQAADRRNRVLAEGDTTPTPYIRITFEATDAVGVEDTECSLDGQAFTSCTSPVVYDRLSRGTHQVTVRSADEAGNTGEDRFLFTVGSSAAATAPGRQ